MSASSLMQPPKGAPSTTAVPDPQSGTVAGRLAYPDVFAPKRFQEQRSVPGSGSGESKFSCSIIAFGKFVEPMKAAVQATLKATINNAYPDPKKLPPRGLLGVKREPIIKLVADYPKMWPDAPEDAIFLRAASLDMPVFVDSNVQTLSVDEAKLLFIAGCWVRMAFRAFHQDKYGDPRISLALNCLQFIRPGPRLGVGRTAPGDLLSSIDDDDPLFADLDV
jgi:hypothetical protein